MSSLLRHCTRYCSADALYLVADGLGKIVLIVTGPRASTSSFTMSSTFWILPGVWVGKEPMPSSWIAVLQPRGFLPQKPLK